MTKTDTGNNSDILNAKSVFDTGRMMLLSSVSGFIIYIPDEAHHPLVDNKTISLKNANYVPNNLLIPKWTSIAFVHGDPQHIYVEILKDSTGKAAWQTVAINHPGGSDVKVLSPGSALRNGNVTVEKNVPTDGSLVIEDSFAPTPLQKYKSDFNISGFQVLSEYNF